MANNIGQLLWERLKISNDDCDSAARAVALHVLDLAAAAGVTPAEAAAQLRAGRTIEEVCAAKKLPGCECDLRLPSQGRCDKDSGVMRCNGSVRAWQETSRARATASR